MAHPEARKPDVVFVAITKADGGLAVMQFITNEYRPASESETKALIAAGKTGREAYRVVSRHTDPTPENIADAVAKTAVSWGPEDQPISWRIVDRGDLIDDRTFRNAWMDNGRTIDVDMTKAREIHKDRLRAEREPLLADLDTAYMKADEAGDVAGKAVIAAQKQKLRDVTDDPAIEAAKTPADLKAVGLPDIALDSIQIRGR